MVRGRSGRRGEQRSARRSALIDAVIALVVLALVAGATAFSPDQVAADEGAELAPGASYPGPDSATIGQVWSTDGGTAPSGSRLF